MTVREAITATRFALTLPLTFLMVVFAACLPVDNRFADWLFGLAIDISGMKKGD